MLQVEEVLRDPYFPFHVHEGHGFNHAACFRLKEDAELFIFAKETKWELACDGKVAMSPPQEIPGPKFMIQWYEIPDEPTIVDRVE